MNVDHIGEARQEVTAQHLHVFGQNRFVDLVLSEQREICASASGLLSALTARG